MNRRDFLKASLSIAGAAVLLKPVPALPNAVDRLLDREDGVFVVFETSEGDVEFRAEGEFNNGRFESCRIEFTTSRPLTIYRVRFEVRMLGEAQTVFWQEFPQAINKSDTVIANFAARLS